MKETVRSIFNFLGREVAYYFVFSTLIGVFWFTVESGFVYIMQGFLLAMGLIESEKTFLPDWYPRTVVWAIALLICYGLVRGILYGLKVYVSAACQQVFIKNQRVNIVQFMFKNLESLKSHEMMSLFTEKATNAGFLLMSVSTMINTAVSTVLFLGMGFYVAPREQLIAVVLLLLLVLPMKLFDRGIKRSGQGLAHEWSQVNEGLLKGIRNYIFLKIYGITQEKANQVVASLKNYFHHYDHYLLRYSLKKSYPLIAGIIVISITTYISVSHFDTSPMKLLSFFYIFIRFAQSASDLTGTTSDVMLHQYSFKDLFRLHRKIKIHEKVHPEQISQASFVNETPSRIEIENVGFTYADTQEPTLKGINLNVAPGDFVLIKGPSGSGKSTLLYLILGLLKPTKGQILLNGNKLDGPWAQQTENFAYVGPEPFIIEGTVKDNLCYGLKAKVNDGDCWAALELADLNSDIGLFKKGLDENLHEMTQLSTGQKQRLALARAFLRKPKIVVLDEATANLDEATEKRILSRILSQNKETIFIVVSHKNTFDEIATKRIELN